MFGIFTNIYNEYYREQLTKGQLLAASTNFETCEGLLPSTGRPFGVTTV